MFSIPNQGSGNGNPLASLPILCKILMLINILLFIGELIFPSIMSNSCMSPFIVMNYFSTNYQRLWLSNFFHSNPIYSGPIGIFHILLNMMTLYNVGSFVERKVGSFGFLGISLFFIIFVGPMQIPISLLTNFISRGAIPLLSTHQCGIGYSGVLFGYFMVMLRLTPGETAMFCGMRVKKWIQPLLQLILLSFLINASFIGHLSGIVTGYLYITGIPGFFQQRQKIIKKLENIQFLNFLTKRNDFIVASQQPCFDHFNFTFFLNRSVTRSPQGNTYNQLLRSEVLGGVTGRSLNNGNNNGQGSTLGGTSGPVRGGKLKPAKNVEMTIVNGVLVPKNSPSDTKVNSTGNATPDGI